MKKKHAENKTPRVAVDGVLFKKNQVDALKAIKEVELVVNLDEILVDEAVERSESNESVNIFEHDFKYCGKSSE